ncbi:hypothetical protein BH23CHL6_BH23CHL6_02300 [soil metagenome]
MIARVTSRQRVGRQAETDAAQHLQAIGWEVLARNIRTGRDEIDVLALDPGPPRCLVVVEVRSLRSTAFGAPEEGVSGHKVMCLYRALATLRAAGELPGGRSLPAVDWRVDLLVVDRRPGHQELRHLRALAPPG